MKFACVAVVLLLAGCVGNRWGEEGISSLLAGRTVTYGDRGDRLQDAMWQSWSADGTTETGGSSVFHDKVGRWRVIDGRYCEMFGASTAWTCWKITVSEGGAAVRFWEIPQEAADLLIFHKDMTGWFAD